MLPLALLPLAFCLGVFFGAFVIRRRRPTPQPPDAVDPEQVAGFNILWKLRAEGREEGVTLRVSELSLAASAARVQETKIEAIDHGGTQPDEIRYFLGAR